MPKFSEGAGNVVASDTRSALSDLDKAYLANLRMAASIVETFDGAGVPAAVSQKLYATMSESVSQLVGVRKEMVSAIGQLLVIKDKSNIAETDLGCLSPWGSLDEPVREPVGHKRAPITQRA